MPQLDLGGVEGGFDRSRGPLPRFFTIFVRDTPSSSRERYFPGGECVRKKNAKLKDGVDVGEFGVYICTELYGVEPYTTSVKRF